VGDASQGLWSTTSTFQTAPTSGAFSFLDLADPQAKDIGEAQLAASTFTKALATVPDSKFITVNGDLVDDGSVGYEWDWLFNNIGQSFLNTTIAPITGNHDEKLGSFTDHFELTPASGSDTSTGVYYSYDYSNAHFVMLTNNENTSVNDISPAQVAWMKADITKARANGSQWIILDMHKGPHSTSNHSTDTDINSPTGSRNTVAPIMAQLGIDLVLQGHDHIYARSKPINPNGTIYLIPATAGPKVYYKNKNTSLLPANYYSLFDIVDENHVAIYGPDPTDATRPVRSQIQNFESIKIDGNKLSVISYEIDQNKKDAQGVAQPYIIDTFGISKPTSAKITAVSQNVVAEKDKAASYTVSMNNLNKANAFEVTVKYDSSLFTLGKIDYLLPNLTQLTKTDENGELKLVFGKPDKTTITTRDYEDLVKLNFIPKTISNKKTVQVQLLSANASTLDTITGNYSDTADVIAALEKASDSTSITFASDINLDGNITLADLSIALAYYMDSSSSANWISAKKADVNYTGVVDIIDLQMIAGYLK